MTDTIQDVICEWCGTNLTIWQGNHDANCPYELLEFIKGHICHGDEKAHKFCFPCSEHLEEKMKSSHFDFSLAESWTSPKFHTEFCREMRDFLERRTAKKPQILPKITKPPKPESET